jgi:hypothetical protein
MLPGRLASVLFFTVGIYLYFTAIPRSVMANQERQPMRKAAQVARQESHTPTGDHRNTVTAVFGQSDDQIFSYDPLAIRLKPRNGDTGEAHLQELAQQAEAKNQVMIVYFCNLARAEKENPGIMATLRNPDNYWFRETLIPGVEDMWTYRVYRYLPGQK